MSFIFEKKIHVGEKSLPFLASGSFYVHRKDSLSSSILSILHLQKGRSFKNKKLQTLSCSTCVYN